MSRRRSPAHDCLLSPQRARPIQDICLCPNVSTSSSYFTPAHPSAVGIGSPHPFTGGSGIKHRARSSRTSSFGNDCLSLQGVYIMPNVAAMTRIGSRLLFKTSSPSNGTITNSTSNFITSDYDSSRCYPSSQAAWASQTLNPVPVSKGFGFRFEQDATWAERAMCIFVLTLLLAGIPHVAWLVSRFLKFNGRAASMIVTVSLVFLGSVRRYSPEGMVTAGYGKLGLVATQYFLALIFVVKLIDSWDEFIVPERLNENGPGKISEKIKSCLRSRVSFRVHGEVQGVGFRYFTQKKASSYGLTGWVRNTVDSKVEGEAQGEDEVLQRFMKDIDQGPTHARVARLEKSDVDLVDGESGFEVRR
ncbi:acylphosphatase family protein [Drepanopeziza brunnea f. sp. 'multigermtubi' MB_m1]|uniref:acylphosphatase n=1 Tax=Marssonina brunnea f. sp. multigermtubi (strain MB_m1) TaxID=1072389 RepID=K1X4U0_MARBU|nr:acylphosphatase family protein [Drepanopeziza brunnea f. sp. 'multigermtubi' MB_m1]EKD20102.1 acylphosphatase family protein [Drepanopeziza brunnea f. sp. 'multigermtubi' MB_m1]